MAGIKYTVPGITVLSPELLSCLLRMGDLAQVALMPFCMKLGMRWITIIATLPAGRHFKMLGQQNLEA